MRHFKYFAASVLLLTLILAACGPVPEQTQPEDNQPEDAQSDDTQAEDETQISLIVSASPVRCVGVAEDCLQVKFSPEGDWEALQSRIEGFEYELGYRYVLLVEAQADQAADSGSAKGRYKLVQVQEKSKELEVNPNDLGGTFWVLSTSGGMAQPDAASTRAQVSFQYDPAENMISGRAGCNTYMANAKIDYAQMTLEVATVGTTRMACPEEVMELEYQFLEMLDRVASYAVEEGMLYLFTTDSEVLTFVPGTPSR